MIKVIREPGTDYLFAGFLEKELNKSIYNLSLDLYVEPKRGEFYFCQDYFITRNDFPVKYMFYALPSHKKDVELIMGDDCSLVTYAADPDFHKPAKVEKKYDIGFIGNRYYPERLKYLEMIQNLYSRTFLNLDTCPPTEIPLRLSECKILFNHTRPEIDVNLRFFEEMALGCQIMLRTPALKEFAKEGTHYFGYSSEEECASLIADLLKDDDKREKTALNARTHFLSNHTYAHRANKIIVDLKKHFERNI